MVICSQAGVPVQIGQEAIVEGTALITVEVSGLKGSQRGTRMAGYEALEEPGEAIGSLSCCVDLSTLKNQDCGMITKGRCGVEFAELMR